MRLHLVRHGPTHAKVMVGWSDLPADLSDTAAVARLNAHLPAGALLLSSDLSRARATADALQGARRRLPDAAGWRELHFGAWELRSFAEVEAETPEAIRAFWETPGDTAPPGGESWNQLLARIGAAKAALPAAEDLVIVCHFGAILALMQLCLGLTVAEVFARKIDPLSVTELHETAAGWRAGRINHRP